MQKFMLNITASSGEFYQGDCESLTLPTGDGVYGVQAGHSPGGPAHGDAAIHRERGDP